MLLFCVLVVLPYAQVQQMRCVALANRSPACIGDVWVRTDQTLTCRRVASRLARLATLGGPQPHPASLPEVARSAAPACGHSRIMAGPPAVRQSVTRAGTGVKVCGRAIRSHSAQSCTRIQWHKMASPPLRAGQQVFAEPPGHSGAARGCCTHAAERPRTPGLCWPSSAECASAQGSANHISCTTSGAARAYI